MGEYIKSPLNYVGGKYKLLDQIIPKFPKNIKCFIDVFGGGFNVGINVDSEIVAYNDINKPVVDLLATFYHNSTNYCLETIDGLIKEYNLSKINQEGYLALRDFYNKNISDLSSFEKSMTFYTLVCHAFNNQIRFNSKGEFNMPFGKDRSEFNPTLRQKFIDFVEAMHKKEIYFNNGQFNTLSISADRMYYFDPPYYNSVASYNENGGWTEQNEIDLMKMLDNIISVGAKFALSNNLKYDNPILKEWLEKNKDRFNIYHLNHTYSNCNYQKKDKSADNEILVTNYKE